MKFPHTAMLDPLERRRLLAGAVIDSGILIITGNETADAITLSPAAAGQTTVAINGATSSFSNAAFTAIRVAALGGNDKISIANSITKASTLLGGAGNDSVAGGGGPDVIDGGAGGDTIRGGGGSDTADYSSRTVPITVGLGTLSDDGAAGEKDNVATDIETILGGSAADTLKGAANNNRLVGNGGNDTLIGLDGNDTLEGGAGADSLDGGGGNDTGVNTAGDTLVSIENGGGGPSGGARAFIDSQGTLVIEGTSSADFFELNGNDQEGVSVNFGNGQTSPVFTNYSRIRFFMFGGDDRVELDASLPPGDAVHVDLGDGNDGVIVRWVEANVIGGAGNDRLYLDTGGAIVSFAGGDGTDTIATDQDASLIYLDLNLYPTVENANLHYGTIVGNALNNHLEVETEGALLGNGGNDVLFVNSVSYPVLLDGGAGNDLLQGGDYDDTLIGGTGSDTLKGGFGNDTADYSSRTGNLTIGPGTLADDGEAGEKDNVAIDIETILGGAGNDNIKGTAGANRLVGNGGNDTLIGLDGNDTLAGGIGADRLEGGNGNDTLLGGGGNDNLFGGSGNDSIRGEAGDDLLDGQAGADTLDGGDGSDRAFDDEADTRTSIETLL